jgi:hypothetical protein
LALIFFRDGTLAGSVYTLHHLVVGMAHPVASFTALSMVFGRRRVLYAFAGLVTLAVIDASVYLRSAGWKPLNRVPHFANLPRSVRWACYYAAIFLALNIHQQSTQFIYVQF